MSWVGVLKQGRTLAENLPHGDLQGQEVTTTYLESWSFMTRADAKTTPC